MRPGKRGRIVVGVDGSEPSQRALEWAAHEAVLRQANLRVVHAVQLYVRTLGLPTSPRLFSADVRYPGDLLEAGRDLLDAEIARLGLKDKAVEVSSELVRYPPAAALVEESKLAELLVLGSRRRRVLPRLIRASVPEQCAKAAHCPVVVVGARAEM
ncbi:MAG: universal stress protein [Candidatus Dormiibacterota bacterium]